MFYFLANPVKVNGCKDFEDNSCVDDSDCCSLYCLKQFNNNIGVCKHPDKSRPNLYCKCRNESNYIFLILIKFYNYTNYCKICDNNGDIKENATELSCNP